MATAGIVVCSSYGMSCIECNELQIAPKSSAHVSNYEVRNLWSCDNCGLVTELAVNPRINPRQNQARAVNRPSLHESTSSTRAGPSLAFSS